MWIRSRCCEAQGTSKLRNQSRAGEPKMAVQASAACDALGLHHRQPVCVGKGQVLIGTLLDGGPGFFKFWCIETLHANRQLLNEIEERDGLALIITPKKPAVPLRYD